MLSLWERRIWFWCSVLSCTATLGSLFADGVSIESSITIILPVFLLLVFGWMIIAYLDPAHRGEEMPAAISPESVRWCNPVGVVLGGIVVIGLYCRQPATFELHLAFFLGFVSVFSIDMLLRPVGTDMGLLYAFYGLCIGTSVRDYHYQYPTWVIFIVCTALVFVRAHFESTSIVAAAAAAREATVAAAAREIGDAMEAGDAAQAARSDEVEEAKED